MNFNVKYLYGLLDEAESKYLRKPLPLIDVGDTVRIGVMIQEGNKERVQYTEGVVIAKKNTGLNHTLTIRKVLQGIGVERIYLIHSPRIKQLSILSRAKVRRSKLYYLRGKFGKATRLKQKFT